MIDVKVSLDAKTTVDGKQFMFGSSSYRLNEKGQLFKEKKGKWQKVLAKVRQGHRTVVLTGDGDSQSMQLAKLMMRVLSNSKRDGTWSVSYIDGNNENCDLSNLEWVSRTKKKPKPKKILKIDEEGDMIYVMSDE